MQRDINQLYKVLVFDLKKKTPASVQQEIEAVMRDGYSPSQVSWSPNGRHLIYTMVHTSNYSEHLAELLIASQGNSNVLGGLNLTGFGSGGIS